MENVTCVICAMYPISNILQKKQAKCSVLKLICRLIFKQWITGRLFW